MSIAHYTPEPEAQIEASDVYAHVVHGGEVCSRCHRRIRSGSRSVEWGGPAHDKIDHDPVPEYSTSDRESYGELSTYPFRTVCEACGYIVGDTDGEPLARRTAVRSAGELAIRIHDADITVDMETLKYCVGRLKSDIRFSNKDALCFAAATAVAVRKSR